VSTHLIDPVPLPARRHTPPGNLSDRVALALTRSSRWFADRLFGDRYAHRAVVLETVAAVPGMVGATLQHLAALRRLKAHAHWVAQLGSEAENERMHLVTFLHIARPTRGERLMVRVAQGVFFNMYFLLYLVSPRTAHRMVGYFEEEAVASYSRFADAIVDGRMANTPAPALAIEYWKLPPDARLLDVVLAVRQDEMRHRDTNHRLADTLNRRAARKSPGLRAH
jgi:ubiquinol oxidase